LVRVDPDYFRPTEVDLLLGNPAKALKSLGWRPTTTFREMVAEMIAHDLAAMQDLPHHPSGPGQAFANETSHG
jgi:GDPmannose 4,6-dehydratase